MCSPPSRFTAEASNGGSAASVCCPASPSPESKGPGVAEEEKRQQRSRKARGLDAIDRDVYYSSYRVLASYLGYIDKTLEVRRKYHESDGAD